MKDGYPGEWGISSVGKGDLGCQILQALAAWLRPIALSYTLLSHISLLSPAACLKTWKPICKCTVKKKCINGKLCAHQSPNFSWLLVFSSINPKCAFHFIFPPFEDICLAFALWDWEGGQGHWVSSFSTSLHWSEGPQLCPRAGSSRLPLTQGPRAGAHLPILRYSMKMAQFQDDVLNMRSIGQYRATSHVSNL